MRRIFLITVLCVTYFVSARSEGLLSPLRLTLGECIDYALSNSYSRRVVRLNEEVARDRYNQSTKERLPDLSATVGENLNRSGDVVSWEGSYSLNASLVVYQGGSISGNIEKSRLSAEQSGYITKRSDNELVIRILQTFLTTLGNEELLKHRQLLLQSSEEQLSLGRARYRLGEILESDFLLLESQYATDRSSIVEAEIARENSLLELKSLLSMDMQRVLEIEYASSDSLEWVLPDESSVLEAALLNLPDLSISRCEVALASAAVKLAKSGYYPTVGLTGVVGSGHLNGGGFGGQLSDRFSLQGGITVSIPIFDRSRTKSNVTQSRLALRQAELESSQSRLLLEQTILQEYRSVRSSLNSYESSKIRESAYAASLSTSRRQYEAGAITTVEMIQQRNNYMESLNAYIQDKYAFLLRRKILDVYMGREVN